MADLTHLSPADALAAALRDPACYPHAANRVEHRETHISHVFLAGEFAYKVKKPVKLAFLDFSALGQRQRLCEEEVRLNRRTAPGIYLDVVPIGGSFTAPRVGAGAPVLEWAVRMRRFDDQALFSELARRGELEAWHAEALAEAVAAFHRRIAGVQPPPGLGTAAAVIAPALENFPELRAAASRTALASDLVARLEQWTRGRAIALESAFARRRDAGFVRECHGDLHLANVVLLDGAPLLYDCIEFAPRLRWIDVMADVAFAFMDFIHFGLARHAFAFLGRYLEITGDYEGLALLRFYAAYRAVVRAKVAAIGGAAPPEVARYLALARSLSQDAPPVLVAMHGLSGSGKTTVSRGLAQALGAVRVRSDVERKRLHGLPADARTGSGLGQGIYGARGSERTYVRLAALAASVLEAGFPVVVDAAFLEEDRRRAFEALARTHGAAFQIASCVAPGEVLRSRLIERARAGGDASEAGTAVLELQERVAAPLTNAERIHATFFDTSRPGWKGEVERLAYRLRLRPEG